MKRRNLYLYPLWGVIICLCVGCGTPQEIRDAAENVSITKADVDVLPVAKLTRSGDGYVQRYKMEDGELLLRFTKGCGDAVCMTSEFVATRDLDSLELSLRFFNLEPDSIRYRYCLPHCLPWLKPETEGNVPRQWTTSFFTLNNTFSLITDKSTFSISILPPEERMEWTSGAVNPDDYAVSFADSSSIYLKSLHRQPLSTGEKVIRRFLISQSDNISDGMATGLHIGEYINEVGYKPIDNLTDIYRKSMHYVLKNQYAYGETADGRRNYYGSIISSTGEPGPRPPQGNGYTEYAMYGNSFSVAALNQYLQMNPTSAEGKERLGGVDEFLLHTDVLTPEGAYWSMLDLMETDNQGFCDQAFRKWLETHATAWITYYMLNAYEMTGAERYAEVLQKTLAWLAAQQREDGSFPKYFENGQPSSDNMGDVAWAILAFLKADELDFRVDNTDFRACALRSITWVEENLLEKKWYYGSFEDVSGPSDSYCPSVTAHAFLTAAWQIGEKRYLEEAKHILSVSLAYLTTDYNSHWGTIRPAFAQIESVVCYFPASYTLPMMCLACAEAAMQSDDARERDYWTGVSKTLSFISDFMPSPNNTCDYGMEWQCSPFLVFSEWGNMQLSWVIVETLKNRIAMQCPDYRLDAKLSFRKGKHAYTLFMPEWEGVGSLIEPIEDVEPVFFRDESGEIYVLLLGDAEGKNVTPKSPKYPTINKL